MRSLRHIWGALLMAGWAWMAGGTSYGQSWDVRTDFSTTNNPNGVWRFGWSTELTGTVVTYPDEKLANNQPEPEWIDNSIIQDNCPHVISYEGDVEYGYAPPHSMLIQAGPANQFSHSIWTAPAAGTYTVNVSFTALDYGGPHGYVLKNGVVMGDSLLTENVEKDFDFASMTLAAGDTIDVVAGVGTDGSYYNDESMFTFTVTKVPDVTVAKVYDARTDFSTTQNPTGAWSYGWSTELAGPMTIYPNEMVVNNEPEPEWIDNSIAQDNCPHVISYQGDVAYGYAPPHSMLIQAGPANQFSHCRWTAPEAGTYKIVSSFTALDIGNPHGYLLMNGTSIGDNVLRDGVENDFNYSSVTLAKGDTIEAVAGVGPDGTYYNDEAEFGLTISLLASGSSGPVVAAAGTYTGLLSGTSGGGLADGTVTVRVAKTGNFTGVINVEGQRVALSGSFDQTGAYSATVSLGHGKTAAVVLDISTDGGITGSITAGGVVYEISAEAAADGKAVSGSYNFAITTGSAAGVPDGSGFGYMNVNPNGLVSIIGVLGDGRGFTTTSRMASATSFSFYCDPYNKTGSGISGTVDFADVPGESDATGTLYWSRAATKGTGAYAQGFATTATLTASLQNQFITGLNGGTAMFDASGADLAADFTSSVTLRQTSRGLPYDIGKDLDLSLNMVPEFGSFAGSFLDGTTNKRVHFTGVLLPKSRTGAGYFISGGVSGGVEIGY